MRYTELGKTGLVVSKVSFGGIPVRRSDWDDAVKIVRAAFEQGVTYYDTAQSYGNSEEKIGAGLEGHRHEVVLATKTHPGTKAAVQAAIEASLRRLRTDYIDVYQLHDVRTEEQWERVRAPGGALEAIHEAKQAGKIRHIGVSSHSKDMALKMIPSGEFETVMLAFSYLEPEAAEKILPLCHEHGVAFVCMKPFAGGALNTPVQCLKWVLQQGVDVVVPGIGSIAELDQDLAVADMDWTLSAEDVAAMEAVKAELTGVYCRSCEYCQPCTTGISISNVLRSNLFMHRIGPEKYAGGGYEQIRDWVEGCTECGECEPRCPYDLPIRELLRQRLAELQQGLRAAGWNI